jgi:hypothetical protein
MKKYIQPFLFLTDDASIFPLGLNRWDVARIIDSWVGDNQQFLRSQIGQTFVFRPCKDFRGRAAQSWYMNKGVMPAIIKELNDEGKGLFDPDVMHVIFVWGPQEAMAHTGYLGGWWTNGASISLHQPSLIHDFLVPWGYNKSGTPWGLTWDIQAGGRVLHEIVEDPLNHTGGLMTRWYDYRRPGANFTSQQKDDLRASPWMWMK